MKIRNVLSSIFFLTPCLVYAIEDRADIHPGDSLREGEKIVWKSTISLYSGTISGEAYDFNVRGNNDNFTFWVGSYRDRHDFEQTRIGLEYPFLNPYGKIVPSFQIASGGFSGASLTYDGRTPGLDRIGPLLGISRTNLRSYVNLNFDPNDAILFGFSYAEEKLGTLMLYRIKDDRLGTGQEVTHLVWRNYFAEKYRFVADVFKRRGAERAGQLLYKGSGVSLTLDISDYFLRVGYDPRANYSTDTITRISAGIRF